MRWDLKAVGRLIVTLALMCCAVAFMFAYPKYSWTAVIVVSLLVIWDFMYYKDFQYFKFGKNGIEAKSTSNEEENNRELKDNERAKAFDKSKENTNFHEKFKKYDIPAVTAIPTDAYVTPEYVYEFIKLVNHARENNYDFKSDPAYVRDAELVQRWIVNVLLESFYNYEEYQPIISKYRDKIINNLYGWKFKEDYLLALKVELISKFGNEPLIKHRFQMAINDLNKVSA